ncbi:TPA_asm: hypothetical protein [ssRNA phage Gerhypos.2_34]|uniref:Uncharacterized protein n=2 Tax=Fiersviridae TaxID=2842319 RepID=A0A8S5KYU6_9VIRU|nr:hypothetical protein QIL49_gp1 [ssRNA phage Gerhypos.2_34]DAD50364.1 TPA_asm: hypothetical protein [ssRNA phage Gerhypos.2_34]
MNGRYWEDSLGAQVIMIAIFCVALGVYVVALLLCIYASTDICQTCDYVNDRVLSLAERMLVLVLTLFIG